MDNSDSEKFKISTTALGTNDRLVIDASALTFANTTATDDTLGFSITTGGAGRFAGTLTNADLTGAHSWTLPNLDGTVALTTNKISVFAATTSAELSGVLSDENATGGYMTNIMSAAGDLIYGGASGAPTRLGEGTNNGYVLKINTTTHIPYWSTDLTGGGGGTLQNAYDASSGNTILTTDARNIALTLANVTTPTSFTIENQDTAGVSAERIFNSITSGNTLTNGLLIEQTGTGTVTNAIQILESAGAITTAINIGNNVTTGISIGTGVTTGISVGSGGITITAGALAVNSDSITSDGTLVINANGNVDVQDILNADSITTDTNGVTIAASGSYPGSGAVTLDSGSTNALNIGTGANAKTITIGNVSTSTNVTINSGTGGINLKAEDTAEGNIQIGTGGAGTNTPDLFIVDAKDNAGTPSNIEGAMYYSQYENKFKCYENSAWKDCDTTGGGGSVSPRVFVGIEYIQRGRHRQ